MVDTRNINVTLNFAEIHFLYAAIGQCRLGAMKQDGRIRGVDIPATQLPAVIDDLVSYAKTLSGAAKWETMQLAIKLQKLDTLGPGNCRCGIRGALSPGCMVHLDSPADKTKPQ
jgi:hypothetical protein